jgi:hypothetical protein
MKADIKLLRDILIDNEKVLLTLYCSINMGYISRSGILGVTNERLVFLADHMFGEGLKWDFEYHQILNLNVTKGTVIEQSSVPIIEKLVMNHKDEFVVFDKFVNPSKVDELLNLITTKVKS